MSSFSERTMAQQKLKLEALTNINFGQLARRLRLSIHLPPATLARQFGLVNGCGQYLTSIEESSETPSPRILALYTCRFPSVKREIFCSAYYRTVLDHHYRKLRRNIGPRSSLRPIPYPHLKS